MWTAPHCVSAAQRCDAAAWEIDLTLRKWAGPSVLGPLSHLTDSDTGWRFGYMYVAFTGLVVAAHAWSLVITCAAPDLPSAVFLVPISLLPMMLFSGFFKPLVDITWAFRWVGYVDFMRYAWALLCIANFAELPLDAPLSGNLLLQTRFKIELLGGDNYLSSFWAYFGVVLAFAFVFRALAFVVLKRTF